MKKILFVGQLNEIARSLSECLDESFQVQLCARQLENVQALVKIVRPDLILVCQIGAEDNDLAILEWLAKGGSKVPVLAVTTAGERNQLEAFCRKQRFEILQRPVTKKDLLQTCRKLLGMHPETHANERQREQTAPKKKIMLVDDSALLLRSMKTMLEKYYTVCLARSGEQALARIPKEQPDLVLLDYEMEGMDGRAVLEAMKEDEAMKSIPVVFLTSVSNRQSIYSVLKSVPQGYILKPPDETRIIETIEGILGGQSLL